jgi:hypothetical protein
VAVAELLASAVLLVPRPPENADRRVALLNGLSGHCCPAWKSKCGRQTRDRGRKPIVLVSEVHRSLQFLTC